MDLRDSPVSQILLVQMNLVLVPSSRMDRSSVWSLATWVETSGLSENTSLGSWNLKWSHREHSQKSLEVVGQEFLPFLPVPGLVPL